jgi:hypothetical protein
MTRNTRRKKPGDPGERYPDSPAKVPNDLDEAKQLQTDVPEARSGAADADAHHPAAASAFADAEAGATESGGRTEPLRRKG